jgi:hypothetical protein
MSRRVWIHKRSFNLSREIGWRLAASLIFVISLVARNPLMVVEGRQAAQQGGVSPIGRSRRPGNLQSACVLDARINHSLAKRTNYG